MVAYKYVSELWKKKQSDCLRFLSRVRTWEYRQLPTVHRISRPTRIDKARKLGYENKPGFVVYRVRVTRGDRKKECSKGIVFGKPVHGGIKKQKSTRSLQVLAEEKAGRRLGGLRVLNSYWIGQDASHKWFEVILVDPMHDAIRNDYKINWICNSTHKRREIRGLTGAGRKSRGMLVKGSRGGDSLRPSRRANWKRRQLIQLRRYR